MHWVWRQSIFFFHSVQRKFYCCIAMCSTVGNLFNLNGKKSNQDFVCLLGKISLFYRIREQTCIPWHWTVEASRLLPWKKTEYNCFGRCLWVSSSTDRLQKSTIMYFRNTVFIVADCRCCFSVNKLSPWHTRATGHSESSTWSWVGGLKEMDVHMVQP